MSTFFEDIKQFNDMYKLPFPERPLKDLERCRNFEKILREEVDEIDDVFALENMAASNADILTAQADLYGDIIVYCTSEMRRIGLNPEIVLGIIMRSNFSKLGEDGLPIYDERGKVLKGPNYWKPEPEIKNYIELAMSASIIRTDGDNDAQDCNEEENGS